MPAWKYGGAEVLLAALGLLYAYHLVDSAIVAKMAK